MSHRALVLVALLSAAALPACAPVSSLQGFQVSDVAPKDMKVGEDTKSTVMAKIGSPSATSTFDPNQWFYMSQVVDQRAFFRPKVRTRDVTAISFDKDSEKVASVNVLTLADGKVIAFNGRETPTRGRELTILEQILGNVGRGGVLPQTDENLPGNTRR